MAAVSAPFAPAQAVKRANQFVQLTNENWHNLCLKFVRTCFGVKAKEPNAKKAWENAKFKHSTTNSKTIPAGVPVFWKTRTVNWHVAISIGGGKCISTDIFRRGKPDIVGIDTLSKAWGATLLGWTEDVNGVRVYEKPKVTTPAKPKPKLKATGVIAQEVIKGKWGNGEDRKKRLTAAGYDYRTIQNEVNKRLGIKK